MLTTDSDSGRFEQLVHQIPAIGKARHAGSLIEHARANQTDVKKSIKDLPPLKGAKAASAIIISAGPSVHKRNSIKRIKAANFSGTIICADGAYIACLKAGLIPDFVLTLDPHPTRIVRWFGDHDFEKHTENDDYFARQDLDVEFRKNTIEQNKKHIELVNKHGSLTKAIVASSAPRNVVTRLKEARFDMYWWNPLVDDPREEDSLTRQIYSMNRLPCLNTGGTVGTAAWVFASATLKIPTLALVGMDFGYYHDIPLEQTQTYYELVNHVGTAEGIEQFFVEYTNPLTREKFYTDPTYFWYRKNFLELFEKTHHTTFNCTEGGTLLNPRLACITLDEFLTNHQGVE